MYMKVCLHSLGKRDTGADENLYCAVSNSYGHTKVAIADLKKNIRGIYYNTEIQTFILKTTGI